MPSDLVKARWNGPFDAQLGPGLILKPGDEWDVTPEDLKSSHWIAVGKDAKKAEAEALATALMVAPVEEPETQADPQEEAS